MPSTLSPVRLALAEVGGGTRGSANGELGTAAGIPAASAPVVASAATEGEKDMVLRRGAHEIDVPRSIGYFGGIAAAVAVGLLEPPLGVFIAAVPFIKMLTRPRSPNPFRFVGLMAEGAAQPVGSSGQGTIRLAGEVDE
jgi:hypothetical protein